MGTTEYLKGFLLTTFFIDEEHLMKQAYNEIDPGLYFDSAPKFIFFVDLKLHLSSVCGGDRFWMQEKGRREALVGQICLIVFWHSLELQTAQNIDTLLILGGFFWTVYTILQDKLLDL